MDYKWEEFEDGQMYMTKDRIHVTINRKGKLYLNRNAIAALGNPDGVSLLYDKRQATIGVRASPLNRRSAFVLRKKKPTDQIGRVICMGNFCRRHNIRPSGTIFFTSPQLTNDGILVLDLNDVREVEHRGKRRSS